MWRSRESALEQDQPLLIQTKQALKSRNAAARNLICIVGLAWGLNWLVTRLLLQSLAPLTLRTLAIALGALVLFGIAILKRQGLDIPARQRRKVAMAAIFNVTVFDACSAYSQLFGSTSRAVVIAYSMPSNPRPRF